MTSNECIICTELPVTLPTVVQVRHTFKECARVQQKEFREDRFDPSGNSPPIFKLPMDGIICRLIYGSQKMHNYVIDRKCTEFNVHTTQKEPPTDYRIDQLAEYECFPSGGFTPEKGGVNVDNTTVNCNVIWVLSWFPRLDPSLSLKIQCGMKTQNPWTKLEKT